MGRKRVYEVIKHLSAEELDKRIKKLEKDTRVLQRLYFIRHLYRGMSVEEAADLAGTTKATGYAWLKRWNSKGYEGLIPEFGGGRPSKLTEDEKEELKEMLKRKDSWTTKEVQDLIEDKFGVNYSSWQVRRILKSFGMKYAKPYQKDYRRPENAEETLKNLEEIRFNQTDIIGFVDEMAVEANANTARMWSFSKPFKRVATYIKAKVSGFYSINGESIIEFPERNKAEDFVSFLRKIRNANPEKRIVVILDNFRTHHAKKVREKAEELDIVLVYLPPYSPDLNPIENVWKSVKRVVSEVSPLNVEELKETISKAFRKLTRSTSFAKDWIEKFLGDKFRMLYT
ncbi:MULTISPECIES: IS630 family transposase [Methanothermobacter]|nr:MULTISPECIES: IS630 family transposase [Methanothermobacter]QEF94381.1 IS630 family transposase [Methanothermobacter sp. KEPCO-1]QHN08207.1 IS630 family transposase [Methanothermobacter sp. THM-2]WBF09953.1 IS630 family transposase [Methanothermobacter marburgensis]